MRFVFVFRKLMVHALETLLAFAQDSVDILCSVDEEAVHMPGSVKAGAMLGHPKAARTVDDGELNAVMRSCLSPLQCLMLIGCCSVSQMALSSNVQQYLGIFCCSALFCTIVQRAWRSNRDVTATSSSAHFDHPTCSHDSLATANWGSEWGIDTFRCCRASEMLDFPSLGYELSAEQLADVAWAGSAVSQSRMWPHSRAEGAHSERRSDNMVTMTTWASPLSDSFFDCMECEYSSCTPRRAG